MPKRKQPDPSARSPLATKPLAQAEAVTASPAPVAIEAPHLTQSILARLLSGTEPATRQEAFLLIRWQRLAKAQRHALAYEWGLPGEKREDKKLAEQAIGELGR